jgi:2'-5' RNA ligase
MLNCEINMKKHRIFIAIDIPEGLKDVAEKEIEGFYKNPLARAVERENWHITLVFCGYLDEEKLKELKEKAKKIAEKTEKFELAPDKIIFAPPAKNPRMVWLTFKRSPKFLKLSKEFSQFSKNSRETLPHLTLIRFKEFYYPNLKKLLPENGTDLKNEGKSFIIESINIMESHLSPNGPKYELLCRNYLR